MTDGSEENADEASESNWVGEEEVMGEAETIDYETSSSIDLESSRKSCECRLDESEDDQTPSPDPLREFLQKMQAEVAAGRLETIFRLPGIGPPVSPKRVTTVSLWLTDCARRQQGLIGPRNIRHDLCPDLHDIADCGCT